MSFNHGVVLALSVATVLALAACGPAARPVATPNASPSSAATPTRAPAPDVAETRIEITTLSLDVYSDEVLTDSWRHADRDPTELAALTDYFGIDSTVSSESEPGEGADSTYEIHTWPGFEIRYIVSEWGPKNFFITVTAPTVGGVPISARGGIQVGDDLQALAASDPAATSTVPAPAGDLLRVKIDQIPTGIDGYDGPGADFVAAQSLAPFTVVATIYAPQKNYGL